MSSESPAITNDAACEPQVGLGYRDIYRGSLFLNADAIDLLEVTADHFLDATPARLAELDLLREHFTLIPHSLDLSLGSSEGLDDAYVEKLAELVARIDPPWFSDHICFTRAGGVSIGHLAPLPFTREAVAAVARNVKTLARTIRTPLLLENITYVMRFPGAEMSEPEFITRILDETGCELLLDVANLYINSRNFGFCWRTFLDEIPIDRVGQIHFVGSSEHDGMLIDDHSNPTQSAIWEVFDEVVSRTKPGGAILERDDNFPPFSELRREIEIARERWSAANKRRELTV